MLTYGIAPEFRGGVHMKPPYAIGSVPSLSGHAIAYRWRSLPRVRRHRASKPQGSSERVLPWQITMDQLIFASLSHTHYWYEVGMLKVPAINIISYHNGHPPNLIFTVKTNMLEKGRRSDSSQFIPTTWRKKHSPATYFRASDIFIKHHR